MVSGSDNDELENLLNSLKQIASNYSSDSKEYLAIEQAAKALLFIQQKNVLKEFYSYLETFDKDLTPEQKAYLKQVGL